jgi:hypothetical protein
MQRRHLDWVLANAESIDLDTLSPGEIAMRRQELDNLRAAWAWSIDQTETELALRLAAAGVRVWNYRGDLAEGVEWVRRTLALPNVEEFPMLRRQALKGLASLNFSRGDMAAAKAALSMAVDCWRQAPSSVSHSCAVICARTSRAQLATSTRPCGCIARPKLNTTRSGSHSWKRRWSR